MEPLEARSICIDLDLTVCGPAGPGGYSDGEPLSGAREALAELRRRGWVLVLYTARHFNHWETTTEWLAEHGIPYDQLVFGKPPTRYYIDDRAIAFKGDWREILDLLASPE